LSPECPLLAGREHYIISNDDLSDLRPKYIRKAKVQGPIL
jgi:hypothetical protein